MEIEIRCDQHDCIHNKYTKMMYECKNPDGVIISTRKGCQSKETSAHTPLKTLDISIRCLNALVAHNITTLEQLKTFINTEEFTYSRYLTKMLKTEIWELLEYN